MATAAPHVKLLRQLSDARDDYRSGALDVDWDGGRATLYMVFGQPSHAVYEEKGKGKVEGNAALAALLRDLPPRFSVEPWRRAMTPSETLHCTIDDLVHHFAELAAAHAPSGAELESGPALRSGPGDDSPDLPYDLTTFPLLPDGDTLGPEVPAQGARVSELAERLGSGLVTLIGPRLRAAATVLNGALVDAVWVDATSHATGETAAMAIVGAQEGSVTAYRFNPDLADALAMLWRLPVEQVAMNLKWLDADALMTTFLRTGDDRVVLVDGPQRGVGLLVNGRLVGAYASDQRRPSTAPGLLRDLLAQTEGRVTVLRRASLAASAPPSRALATAEAEPEDSAAVPVLAQPAFASPAMADSSVEASELEVPAAALAANAEWSVLTPSPVEPEPLPDAGAVPTAVAAAEPSRLGGFHLVDPNELSPVAGVAVEPPPPDAVAEEAPVQWFTSGPEEPDTGGDLGIDFGEVRRELAQVAEAWLGERDSQPVKALIARTRSSVDDFVTTIDTIRALEIAGHEPSVIHAMAKELQGRAAERLCAA
jgi:hypothetical protein